MKIPQWVEVLYSKQEILLCDFSAPGVTMTQGQRFMCSAYDLNVVINSNTGIHMQCLASELVNKQLIMPIICQQMYDVSLVRQK